jgi:hypothetical protein
MLVQESVVAKTKRSAYLQALTQAIRDEWKSGYRKSPDLTIFALHDDGVVAVIEKRFADQARLTQIRELEYNFQTGLHNLVFEFLPGLKNLGRLGSDAVLVVLDGNGKVITVVDPFDPVQPNKFVPPVPADSEQPFVFDRPYEGDTVRPSDEEMFPMQVRSREFMARLKVAPDVIIINETKCDYATQTPGDWKSDRTNDDCAPDDSILT